MFLRRTTVGRDPLPVTMSGIRMGERVLQIGVDSPQIAGAIAAKAGMSGETSIVVADEQSAVRARAGAAGVGALVDVQVAPLSTLSFGDAAFDVVVVHHAAGWLADLDSSARQQALRECYRVLRRGGRAVVIESGARSGLAALLRPAPKVDPKYEAEGGSVRALEMAGFKPVRMLADRDGYRFIEGLKA